MSVESERRDPQPRNENGTPSPVDSCDTASVGEDYPSGEDSPSQKKSLPSPLQDSLSSSSFFAAVRFLTVIPIPDRWSQAPQAFSHAPFYFPLVGLCIGGVGASLAGLLPLLLPPLPTTVLLATFLIAISGGLHLDGLADSADGILSARTREKMLEIMRDSRIGVMGTIAVVAVFSMKVALLEALARLEPSSSPGLREALFLMPIAGRCGILVMIGSLPYLRDEGGMGAIFHRRDFSATTEWLSTSRPRIWIAWSLIFLVGMGGVVAGKMGIVASFGSLLIASLGCLYCRARLGGATGDTYGAISELTELGPPLFFVILTYSC